MVSPAAEVIRPLRRVEYDQLIALGAFQDEPIELLEGALVVKSPKTPPHCAVVTRLTRLLVLAFEGRAAVRCQSAFAALEHSEPEPDLAVIPPHDDDTTVPSTAHLIIEVAESSLAMDRGKKQRIYANNGVPEYWIVNIPERCIEVYTQPSPGEYARLERYERGQSIRMGAFGDVTFAVADILK